MNNPEVRSTQELLKELQRVSSELERLNEEKLQQVKSRAFREGFRLALNTYSCVPPQRFEDLAACHDPYHKGLK